MLTLKKAKKLSIDFFRKNKGLVIISLIGLYFCYILFWSYKNSPKKILQDKKHHKSFLNSCTWTIKNIHIPIYDDKLIIEIFAKKAYYKKNEINFENITIFYYTEDSITKLTAKKGSTKIINGEFNDIKIWDETHVHRKIIKVKKKKILVKK